MRIFAKFSALFRIFVRNFGEFCALSRVFVRDLSGFRANFAQILCAGRPFSERRGSNIFARRVFFWCGRVEFRAEFGALCAERALGARGPCARKISEKN